VGRGTVINESIAEDSPAIPAVSPVAAAPPTRLPTTLLIFVMLGLLPGSAALVAAGQQLHPMVIYCIGALLLTHTIVVVVMIEKEWSKHIERDTERLRAESTHRARLAMAGEFSASIVHEITQPLSAILNNVEAVELLLHQSGQQSALSTQTLDGILTDIRRDSHRANDSVCRLRTLLRKQEFKFERIDINDLVNEAFAIVRGDATRRNMVLRAELEPDLPLVRADPIHLQQVVLNLLVNAMDAMKGTPEDQRWLQVRTRLLAGAAVEVAVLDNGHGLAPEQQARIFGAFYTTKEGGLGLGLSIARSIVQAHGGSIWAEKRASGGASFKVRIPLPRHSQHIGTTVIH
jgi:signal transduction histidine kinase